MVSEKWIVAVVVVAAVWVIQAFLSRTYQRGRLQGMREATEQISRMASFHYECDGEDLPEGVTKALASVARALKQKPKERCDFYLNAIGMLGDAMGAAASSRGFDGGQRRSDPRDGEQRIDMPYENWRIIRFLAHIGFQHRMPNFTDIFPFHFRTQDEAEGAEAAIEKLEFAINHSKSDPEYSDSLARNMLIWNQWPSKEAPTK
jgi:hypothetical protein